MGREIRQRTLAAATGIVTALSGVAFAVGGGLVLVHLYQGLAVLALGLLVGSIVPTLVSFAEIKYEREEAADQARHQALSNFVEMGHQLIALEKEDQLRTTLLEVDKSSPDPDAHRLRQIARWTNDGEANPGKSSMFVHQGVAGRSHNGIKTIRVNLEPGTYIEAMGEFGFSPEQARQFEPRNAYLCCPVVDQHRVVLGVLCFDAVNPDVFTPAHAIAAERLTPFLARWLVNPGREEV
jgi:hypothetical protein